MNTMMILIWCLMGVTHTDVARASTREVGGSFEVAGVIRGSAPFTRHDRELRLAVLDRDGRELASETIVARPVPVTTRFRATRAATFRVRVARPEGAERVELAGR